MRAGSAPDDGRPEPHDQSAGAPRRPVADTVLDQLFRAARTHNVWLDRDIPDALIRDLYDLVRWGPTSANVCPGRFVFVRSVAGRERLARHASGANRPKILGAPVCVIIGYDLDFAQKLPQLFPHAPGAADWFAAEDVAQATAFRNSTLQGAYLILAARALGLDCGPMSGFDHAGIDAEFFASGRVRSNFLCNLGWGVRPELLPRNPRLTFDEACEVA
jgi:3-hydroxypropanoate dehydrogenase